MQEQIDNAQRYLKGVIYATDDPGTLPLAKTYGFQVIVLADVGETPNYPGCIVLSSLLPPPDVVAEIIDEDINNGLHHYLQYIASVEREYVIANILAALLRPKKILIYTEMEQNKEFHIIETLVQFFYEVFGVLIGIYGTGKDTTYICEPRFDYSRAELLYAYDFISLRDYTLITPNDAVPSPRSVSKIVASTNLIFRDLNEATRMAIAIINNIRSEAEHGTLNPLIIVQK